MTELEWGSVAEPIELLQLLPSSANRRKFRLFGVACCRSMWDLLEDEAVRDVVDAIEQVADGLLAGGTLIGLLRKMPMPVWPGTGPDIFNWKLITTGIAADVTDPRTFVWLSGELLISELTPARAAEGWGKHGTPFVPAPTQAAFLRDIFGNPFQPVAFNPAWRTSDAMLLAQGIYHDRAFDRLPILADALQDAGCDSDDLLNHLRDPHATHVRGCWALDLVLGKE